MEPATLNLTVQQGATFLQNLTWSAGTPPQPVDLTGYAARLQARDDYGGTVLFELASDGAYAVDAVPKGAITLGSDGTIALSIPDEQTALLDFDSAVYDLKLTDSLGSVFFLLRGKVKLVRQVTL